MRMTTPRMAVMPTLIPMRPRPEECRGLAGRHRRALAGADPDAATYAANAAAARAGTGKAGCGIASQPCAGRRNPLSSFHDALWLFHQPLRLAAGNPVSLGDASTPSAARLAEIARPRHRRGRRLRLSRGQSRPQPDRHRHRGHPIREGAALDPEGTLLPPAPIITPKRCARWQALRGLSGLSCLGKSLARGG